MDRELGDIHWHYAIDAHYVNINLSVSDKTGVVEWTGNWVTFIDSMLQMYIICKQKRNLVLPVGVDVIKIDPQQSKTPGIQNILLLVISRETRYIFNHNLSQKELLIGLML